MRAYRVDYTTSRGDGGYIVVMAKSAARAKTKAREQVIAQPSTRVIVTRVSDMGPA